VHKKLGTSELRGRSWGSVKPTPPRRPVQLSFSFETPRPSLRVIDGGGRRRPPEPLSSPDAVVRVLVEAAADLLLKRISPERAQEIERQVARVLRLFEKATASPRHGLALQKELGALEKLVSETRARKHAR
jgi:hypothetical protein